ncbi:MAG: restriction endonuclease subunit S, partial [Gallionella sp.]|nr:restriction endonuclease subunit S [Gallionella sp.]
MSEWRKIEISRAFDVNPPRPIQRGKVTPFIPMDALPEHARSVARIDEREFTGSGTKFQNGDTLVARITPCLENGKTAFIDGLADGVVAHGSTEYIVLAGKPNQSDNLFAYYLARSPDFRQYAIGHMEGTSGRQRVPSIAVEKYLVSLPPIEEQRAIAHILGTL